MFRINTNAVVDNLRFTLLMSINEELGHSEEPEEPEEPVEEEPERVEPEGEEEAHPCGAGPSCLCTPSFHRCSAPSGSGVPDSGFLTR